LTPHFSLYFLFVLLWYNSIIVAVVDMIVVADRAAVAIAIAIDFVHLHICIAADVVVGPCN